MMVHDASPRLARRRPLVTFPVIGGVIIAALLAGPAIEGAELAAQARRETRPGPAVKIAKWTLLGTAVGLGAYALRRSIDAADAYDALRTLCIESPARCAHRGGAYADTEAEALYDRALDSDRQAQLGIYTGEAALLGSVAMFILDLRTGDGPPTIPFPGTAVATVRVALVTIEF